MIDLREDLRRAYFTTLSFLGRDQVLVRRIRKGALTLVLNLHRVTPQASPFWPPLHPDLFDDLVGFLRSRIHVTTLSGLASIEPSEPAAVLSFDDGYYDFVEHAAPILRAHGVAANMNVIPASVRSGEPIWNVRLYDALAAAPPSLVKELTIPGFRRRFAGDGTRAKARFGAQVVGFLKRRSYRERRELFGSVEQWLGRVEVPHPTKMMRESDVREAARVHEIGAHSFEHESMGYEDDSFFERDLDKCFEYFRDALELPLTIYAFPNGSYRPSQVEILLARGIRHVLLVDEKMAAQRGSVLPRLTIAAANANEVRLQALGELARGAS
jgi:peptidoglycan/xylan/chitin deacetylase (PgdA/CDA1 family)